MSIRLCAPLSSSTQKCQDSMLGSLWLILCGACVCYQFCGRCFTNWLPFGLGNINETSPLWLWHNTLASFLNHRWGRPRPCETAWARGLSSRAFGKLFCPAGHHQAICTVAHFGRWPPRLVEATHVCSYCYKRQLFVLH